MTTEPPFDDSAAIRKNHAMADAATDLSGAVDFPRTAATCPDWDKVPFDVNCARCGHDLKGQTEPKCAKCGLEFEWSEAVPLEELTCLQCGYHLYGLPEKRCPECGRQFTWEEALAAYHQRQLPIFEYQWRRSFFGSFLRTWWSALRPANFWRNFSIHDPPAVRPLLVMLMMSVGLCSVSCFALAIASDSLNSVRWGWTLTWQRALASAMGAPVIYLLFPSLVVWVVANFGALLLLRQSMNRYRVRTAHIVRVWAHAFFAILPLGPLMVFGPNELFLLWTGSYSNSIEVIVGLIVASHIGYSVHLGYRRYLHMPHSVGIAISTQLVAVLATALVCDLWMGQTFFHYFSHQIFDWLVP